MTSMARNSVLCDDCCGMQNRRCALIPVVVVVSLFSADNNVHRGCSDGAELIESAATTYSNMQIFTKGNSQQHFKMSKPKKC